LETVIEVATYDIPLSCVHFQNVIFNLQQAKKYIKKIPIRSSAVYAAITKTHLTEPQVLHGGKASVLDNRIRAFSPLFFVEMLLQT
jgi:hypothetical protein